MSLADRIIPAEALRWGRLTRCWPWHATHDLDPMNVPPGVIVTRISDDRPPWEPPLATGGFIPKGQPIILTPEDFPLTRPDREDRP